MDIRLTPPEEIIETTVSRLPLSKSVAARVLILHHLTPGARAIDPDRLPSCDDTQIIAAALACPAGTVSVDDCGTAARFLTALFAATPGVDITLTGSPRLCERPVGPLIDALRHLGADITYINKDGYLPVSISGRKLSGGRVKLDASGSSQYASALALAAPLMAAPLAIDLGGEGVSMPYLRMTLDMLQARGVDTYREGYDIHIANTLPSDTDIETEPDWSAAAFWYELAAVTAGWVTLPGLLPDSLQGDSILARIGDRFGVITEFTDQGAELSATPDIHSRLDLELADYPDLVPALAVTACLINVPFRFSGIGHLRHKESDRIADLAAQLRLCGWLVEAGHDSLSWEGEVIPVPALPQLSACGDHRLAMAFASIAAFAPGLVIRGAEAVNKSYPGFWDDLRDTGFTIEEIEDTDL